MSIKATRLKDELKNPSGLRLELDEEATKQLERILNRALNTWPEAPADWKSLADYLMHGKILQPYVDEVKKKSKTPL